MRTQADYAPSHNQGITEDAEARYRIVVGDAIDGIATIDSQGNLVEANAAACVVLGRDRNDLLGRGVAEFASAGGRASIVDAISCMKPGSARSLLPLIERPDGSEFIADIVLHGLPSGEVLAVIRDASQVALLQQSLRSARAEVQRTAEAGSALLRAARSVLDCQDFAETARAVFEACRESIAAAEGCVALIDADEAVGEMHFLGARALQVTPGNATSPMLDPTLLERALRTGRAQYENRLLNSKLAHIPPTTGPGLRNLLISPFQLEGRTVGVIALANKDGDFDSADLSVATALGEIAAVTLRGLHVRETLVANESKLRLLFDGARDAIVWLDASTGTFIDCNPAAEALFGRRRSEILGMHQSSLRPPSESDEYGDFFHGQTTGTLTGVTESEILHTDGRVIPVEISSATVTVDGVDVVQGILRDVTARTRVDRRIRALFNEMLDGFALHEIICDESGVPIDYRFIAANPSFERLTGLKAADIIGRTVLEVMPDIEPFWIERYGGVALTGESTRFEAFSAHLGRHYDVKAYRPAPGQFAVVVADKTEQHRAEEALRISEARLRMAQDAASIGAWEWDVRTGDNVWSDNLWPMYGLDPEIHEASYDAWTQSILPEDRAIIEAIVERASFSGEPFEAEWRVNTLDGSERRLLSRGSPVGDRSGNVTRYLGVVIDVTKERKAIDRLTWTRRKLDEAHRIARIGVWDWVIGTDVITWSPELYTMLHRDVTLPPPSYADLSASYTPESWQLLSAMVAETLESGLPFDVDLAMVRDDDSVCWTRTIGSVMTDHSGQVTGLHGTVHDITDRKSIEDEVRRQRRLLSELASELLTSGERERRHVAVDLHDGVGQTLAVAKIVSQNLAELVTGESKVEALRLVSLISSSISEVRGLTDTLSPPVLYELGLGRGLHWLAESNLERYGLECELQLTHELEGLRGESSILLFRVARELLANVYRHSGVSSATISADIRADTLTLRVSDEGCGFNLSELGTAAQSRRFGLISIREEVSLAGGTVEFDTAIGRGTCVDVRIPLSSPDDQVLSY